MTERRREMIVGIFVLAGIAGLGWLVFKFGDLPGWLSRYDTYQISVYFPQAPGIEENSDVSFRGFRVGRVARIHPPALLGGLSDPSRKYYQVVVDMALELEYSIPANVRPRVYKRGLGGSYIELVLPDSDPISPTLLTEKAQLEGGVSEASEFISESTQRRLDNLVASLTQLSEDLQGQLAPLSPEMVDAAPDGSIRPNITTAVIRADTVLRNLNKIVGDPENQANFRKALANIADLSIKMHGAMERIETLAAEATRFINLTSKTVTDVAELAGDAGVAFQQTGVKVQGAADELAQMLKHLDEMIVKVSAGEGTAGRLVTDPRLYEGLRDVVDNLKVATKDLRLMLEYYQEHGLLSKMKKEKSD